MKLFTVGYEGCTLDEFTETLKKKRIKCVADLRKNPVSRKRGFSKRLLREGLQTKKIDYVHLPGLGTPTEWRQSAKQGLITRAKMFRDYQKKVLPHHPEDIKILQLLMHKKGLALLCYEADASDCHRSLVAAELSRVEPNPVDVINVAVRQPNKQLKLFK